MNVPAGATHEEGHMIFHPPSFHGAYLNFSREKDSAVPYPRINGHFFIFFGEEKSSSSSAAYTAQLINSTGRLI